MISRIIRLTPTLLPARLTSLVLPFYLRANSYANRIGLRLALPRRMALIIGLPRLLLGLSRSIMRLSRCMLPGRQLDFVEYLFRRLRDIDEPFGGCQVVATGDFLQLPPVRHSDSAPYDWAFLSPAWERAGFYTVILDKVRRQDEPDFVRALADFREGRIVGSSAALLQGRVKNFPASNLTRLFTHNVQVDKWNNFQLGELPGDAFVFPALKSGPEAQVEFLQKNLLTPETLMLKPGAVVM